MPRKSKMAILWPANIENAGPDMPAEEADVEANRRVLERKGAVYWDSSPKRREVLDTINGYIYIAAKNKQVEYKCRVEHIVSRDKLLKISSEHQYVPKFRRQCLTGKWEDGTSHPPSETWIKISEIKRLKLPLRLGDFKKWKNGEAVKRVQGGPIYIEDPAG